MSGIVYCERTPDLPVGHIAVIDGKSCMTGADFLCCIWEQLSFPKEENYNWDAYLDWMRDLSWLDAKKVSIVISDFDSFLIKEPDKLKYFVSDLEKVVFPFWKNDAEIVFGDKEAVKDITVYCVSKKHLEQNLMTVRDIVSTIRQNALNGQKTAHSTAQPVLRMHNGKLCFASFVFFYNREELQSARVRRPAMWVVADLKSGDIIQRYLCSENEFSDKEYDRFYDVSTNNLLPVSKFYWCSVYALMDLIRDEYLCSGTVNIGLYKEYLERIYCTTPEEYKIFYKDLNNIEMEEISMDAEKVSQAEELEEKDTAPVEEVAPEAAETAGEKEGGLPLPGEEPKNNEPEAGKENAILEKLEAVEQAMAQLQEKFDDKIAEDTHKNGLFDNMHRELIRYQNGALEKIVDTVALDIIQLVDSTKGHVRVYEKKEPTEENYKKLLRIVKGIAEDMEDILYRQNIESYNVTGHEVDVRRQKIIQTVPTNDKSKDNLIAVRTADGYEKGDKILRPERIKIFKYEAAPETSAE